MGRVVTRSQRLKSLNHHDSHSNNNSRSKVVSDSNSNSKVLLPQDLMLHILTFVHLKCLLTSARYVCKHWAATIRTSQFAQVCLLHSKPGLYVENCDIRTRSYFLDIKTYVNGRFEFERTDFRTSSRMKNVIASCNGIFLLFRRRFRPTRTQIFLVNPITKYWLRTPPLPLQLSGTPPLSLQRTGTPRDRPQLAFQFTLVCVPHTAKFKLFFADNLEVSGAFYYVFYVLTIGIDNSWRVIDRKEAPLPFHLRSIWKPVYDGGNYLYWTNVPQGIIVVDVDKEISVAKFSLPPVPILPPRTFLYFANQFSFLWMGNKLSCIVRKHDCEAFHIYTLDFDSGIWSLYHETERFDYVAAYGRRLNILNVIFRFWFLDQIIFRLTIWPLKNENLPRGRYTVHFSYSVKTRKLTKIEGIATANHEVWLHTNSLISLPSTPT